MAAISVPAAVVARCERFVSGHGYVSPRAALAELAAAVGEEERPDFYGAGELVEGFEREVAELLGKEAAVFMPSGTMAQLVAMRVWAERRGNPAVAFHPTCHLELHEQQSYRLLHGLKGRLVGERHRLITLDDLRAVTEPYAALLLELPAREIGGQLPAWDDLQAQVEHARSRGAAVHMDGARLWEAAPFYGRSHAEVAAPFDTVYVSFYKAPGGIAGAALAGPADFIAEARIWQKRHGGTLIQLYPYVVSARLNLRRRLPRMAEYGERARTLAAALRELPGVRVNPDPPQTRMFHLFLPGDADTLQRRNIALAEADRVLLFNRLRPTDVPGYAAVELSVGDATAALTDAEIAAFFARLLNR